MDQLNPYESPKVCSGNRREPKHWRASLALSIPISFTFWLILIVLLLRPTIDQCAGLAAVLVGSTLGASLGFAKRWLTLVGAIGGGAFVFAATVLTVVSFVEPPAGVTGPPKLFPGLAIFAGVGAGFGLLFGGTTTLVAWGILLLRHRERGAQH
jgi:hypothetical protein